MDMLTKLCRVEEAKGVSTVTLTFASVAGTKGNKAWVDDAMVMERYGPPAEVINDLEVWR
jgi:hypothetical protein